MSTPLEQLEKGGKHFGVGGNKEMERRRRRERKFLRMEGGEGWKSEGRLLDADGVPCINFWNEAGRGSESERVSSTFLHPEIERERERE